MSKNKLLWLLIPLLIITLGMTCNKSKSNDSVTGTAISTAGETTEVTIGDTAGGTTEVTTGDTTRGTTNPVSSNAYVVLDNKAEAKYEMYSAYAFSFANAILVKYSDNGYAGNWVFLFCYYNKIGEQTIDGMNFGIEYTGEDASFTTYKARTGKIIVSTTLDSPSGLTGYLSNIEIFDSTNNKHTISMKFVVEKNLVENSQKYIE